MSRSRSAKWRDHSAASRMPMCSSLCHFIGWKRNTLYGVTSRRRQVANGQRAADEHSPVTIAVALMSRSLSSVTSDIAQ